MARIDVQTLVLAFENRISELEKNPPEKVPTSVILNLLHRAIEETVKEHFVVLIQREIKKEVETTFSKCRDKFIKKIITDIFSDDAFRKNLENRLKHDISSGLKKVNNS